MTEAEGTPAAESVESGGAVESGGRGLRRALAALCITEITSWGTLYYAFPVTLSSLAHSTGWSAGTALSAYSTGLLVSAAAAVPVGRLLGRYGPRPVMTTGSVAGVAALLGVAAAGSLPWFFAAWAGVGVAQALLLYPPAFAALTRWYGPRRVQAVTTLSLVAGLASTVFAPSAAALVSAVGWRATFVVLAVLLGAVTIPLHAIFLSPPWPAEDRRRPGHRTPAVRAAVASRPFAFLASAMMLAAFGLYGATVNLVPLLTSRGISNTLAAGGLGVVGIGQVLGRLGYPVLARRTSPRARTMAVLAAGAVTVAVLGVLPGPVAALLAAAVCAGGARGIYTLLQATAVSDRWGTGHYATLNGITIAPATAAMAIAPACTALLAGGLGGYTHAYVLLAVLILAGAAAAAGTALPRSPHPP